MEAAKQGVDFLLSYFLDKEFGGYFWSTNDDGVVTDYRKYLQGELMVLAALSKYYTVTNEYRARLAAFALLDTIKQKARDTTNGGWYEHFTRDWVLLSEGSGPIGTQGRKTIGTTLTFVTSLTDLLRATGDQSVAALLTEIIQNEVPKFITSNPDNANLELNLDGSVAVSAGNEYGALVETVWLMLDAQTALEVALDWNLFDTYMTYADANSDPGTGGIIADGGLTWWAQAEYLSSFAFTISKRGPVETTVPLTKLLNFIVCNFMDLDNGIWFDEVDSQGNVIDGREAYMWKVGFHETRAMIGFGSANSSS